MNAYRDRDQPDDHSADVLSVGDDRPPARWPALLVTLAVLVGLGWLLLDPGSGPLRDRVERPADAPAQAEHTFVDGPVASLPPGTSVTVPRSGDYHVSHGTDVLHRAGLRVAVREVFLACWPEGWVVDQHPRPTRQVGAGATVVLTVTNEQSARMACPQGVSTATDRALVHRFVAFAQNPGPGNLVPWAADGIEIVGPDMAFRVGPEAASSRDTWTLPVDAASDKPGGYLLADAADLGRSFLLQAAETRRCPGPPQFAHLRRLAVSDTDPTGAPDRRADDCRPGSAVSLYLDVNGAIAGVQVIGGPGP